MSLTIEITFFILILYSVLLIVTGIKLVVNYPREDKERNHENVTIIIPFRNEELRIKPLLETLKNLTGKFNVVFIDDHSKDRTIDVIQDCLGNSIIEYNIVKNIGEGKKQAIQTGVNIAMSDVIYTTDADCLLPHDWLISVHKMEDYSLLKGPVLLNRPKKFFQIIPYVENYILNAFILAYKKVLASGANLAYKKNRFLEVNPYISNDHVLSGDDMFLMEKLLPSEISFHSKVIKTEQEPAYIRLLNQSARWAGKAKYLKDKTILFFGGIITLTNLWTILLAILSLFEEDLCNILFVFIALKFVIDFLLLFLIAVLLNRYDVLKYSIIVELIYPLHIMIVIIFSMFNKVKWKGRSV